MRTRGSNPIPSRAASPGSVAAVRSPEICGIWNNDRRIHQSGSRVRCGACVLIAIALATGALVAAGIGVRRAVGREPASIDHASPPDGALATAGTADPVPWSPSVNDPSLAEPGSAAYRRFLVHDERYFAGVDPARIHVQRPLAPGEHRRPIEAAASRYLVGRPQEACAVPLQVKASPGKPVTFYAPDMGTFENGADTITVEAETDGLASARFRFGGSATSYRVVAASPDCTGWVIFRLEALSEPAASWLLGPREEVDHGR